MARSNEPLAASPNSTEIAPPRRDVRHASPAGSDVLHRGVWHLHFQSAPRQLACPKDTLSRWPIPAVRLSRGPADTPLSFDQGVRLFGPLERLSCRLLEVTASSCLVWIAEGKARIRDKARRAGWGTATKRWGRVCITALLPARIPPSAVAQASNLEDAA